MFPESNGITRLKFGAVLHSDPNFSSTGNDVGFQAMDHAGFSDSGNAFHEPNRASGEGYPATIAPWNKTTPFSNRPWAEFRDYRQPQNALIGSLIREEGHIYSLAYSGELLYTGSDSKNIRVWKNLQEFSRLKSSSGLVKAIVISGEKIFTGHQDGKIRVWIVADKNQCIHKRAGTLPTLKDVLRTSIHWKNYVEVRRNRSTLWIRHSDAISCMSISEDEEFLYSASWDRTMKVWRLYDLKCMESILVHDDAVNSVVTSSGGLVLTGSADGTVKIWQREKRGKGTKHTLVQILLKQDSAVTALAVNVGGSIVYAGSSDGLLNFWSLEKRLTSSNGVVLKGHRLAILCLAANGNMVFSGSADKTICVWRRKGVIHTCVSILAGHSGPVKCLAVEDDRDSKRKGGDQNQRCILYSGSLDKSVKAWSVYESVPDYNQMAMASTAAEHGGYRRAHGNMDQETNSHTPRGDHICLR